MPWGTYTPEAAAKESAAVDGDGGSNWLKISPGRTTLRILPPREGETSPFVVTHQHYISRPGNEPPFVFVCPRHAGVGPCPACAEAAKLRQRRKTAKLRRWATDDRILDGHGDSDGGGVMASTRLAPARSAAGTRGGTKEKASVNGKRGRF